MASKKKKSEYLDTEAVDAGDNPDASTTEESSTGDDEGSRGLVIPPQRESDWIAYRHHPHNDLTSLSSSQSLPSTIDLPGRKSRSREDSPVSESETTDSEMADFICDDDVLYIGSSSDTDLEPFLDTSYEDEKPSKKTLAMVKRRGRAMFDSSTSDSDAYRPRAPAKKESGETRSKAGEASSKYVYKLESVVYTCERILNVSVVNRSPSPTKESVEAKSKAGESSNRFVCKVQTAFHISERISNPLYPTCTGTRRKSPARPTAGPWPSSPPG